VTIIAFHFNVPDRLDYACRLLRKAVGNGARVVATARAPTLQQFDQLLWTFSPTDFVPHCQLNMGEPLISASPVVLAALTESVPHYEVLLNLGDQVPQGFEKFERVIELVTPDGEDRRLARGRWKHYSDCGYTMVRHDLALQAAQ